MTGTVCVPLAVERLALRGTLPGCRVLGTGMGPRRAAAAARAAGLGSAAGVLVAGVAGGLDPRLRAGDLVVATEIRAGGAVIPVPSAPLLAGALRRLGLPVHLGPLACTPTLTTGPDRARLAATGALAVEMESGAVAAVAGGAPFAAVRAVADTADHPLLRPGTPARGLRALAALRRAAPALRQWAAAAGGREIVLASPRSFCAGVERAIEIVARALDRYGAPVYVRRQVVHNAHVVRDLQARGAVFVQELAEVPRGAVAVLAAHGVAPAVRAEAAARRLRVIDATCPLVGKVHAEARRYAARGDTVFLIGHRDHEEVEGTLGEAPDRIRVVEDVAQARTVPADDPDRVAYVMQTTLAVDEADQVAAVLRERFPGLAGPRRDDICYATTNRQRAVRAVAEQADLVLVVGSANSSNALRLVEVAGRCGPAAHLVEDAAAIDLGWLAGARRVGITAAASTPSHLVDEVVGCLAGLGPAAVRETHIVDEEVEFTLPREVS